MQRQFDTWRVAAAGMSVGIPPDRKHLPVRVRSFVNFALDRFRNNPDLVSDPQRLIAPFVRAK